MTATDELRKLLDERGVEWQGYTNAVAGSMEPVHTTYFESAFGVRAKVTSWMDSDKVVALLRATPEQAIAATLGRVTCHADENGNCSECGEDLVRCDVGIGAGGGAVELDPPIYYNFCPNCGREVVER